MILKSDHKGFRDNVHCFFVCRGFFVIVEVILDDNEAAYSKDDRTLNSKISTLNKRADLRQKKQGM